MYRPATADQLLALEVCAGIAELAGSERFAAAEPDMVEAIVEGAGDMCDQLEIALEAIVKGGECLLMLIFERQRDDPAIVGKPKRPERVWTRRCEHILPSEPVLHSRPDRRKVRLDCLSIRVRQLCRRTTMPEIALQHDPLRIGCERGRSGLHQVNQLAGEGRRSLYVRTAAKYIIGCQRSHERNQPFGVVRPRSQRFMAFAVDDMPLQSGHASASRELILAYPRIPPQGRRQDVDLVPAIERLDQRLDDMFEPPGRDDGKVEEQAGHAPL